jgi:hypothetical protein
MTQHLTLVGLSDDRSQLLLVDDAGTEFTLGVDSKLRAALRGEHARLGQLEIEMDSVLRPRDIQARIRAGETPEAVAAAAKTTVDKIMAFAAPVLAEREHVAERAQRSSVRRRAGDNGGSNSGDPAARSTLGDAVAVHLRSLNVKPETVDFDTDRRKGAAQFAFDAPGNFVVTENDDARWLIGELADAPAPAAPAAPPQRRLSAVPDEQELPLGDDAIEMVSPAAGDQGAEAPAAARVSRDDEQPPVRTVDLTDTAAKVRAASTKQSQPKPSFLDTVLREDEPLEEKPEAEEPPAKRPARKKGARASVPSWDEIMFGGGKGD